MLTCAACNEWVSDHHLCPKARQPVRVVLSLDTASGGYLFRLSCGCEARLSHADALRCASKAALARAFDDLCAQHQCSPPGLPAPPPALPAPEEG